MDTADNKKKISSSLSFILKFLLPIGWSIFLGIGTVSVFLQDTPDKFSFLMIFLLGSLFLWLTGINLKKVFIDGDQIVISNYFKTCRIPISEIHSVSENILFSPKLIYITFKRKTIFGEKIKFVPAGSFFDYFSYFGKKHSTVKYIESLMIK